MVGYDLPMPPGLNVQCRISRTQYQRANGPKLCQLEFQAHLEESLHIMNEKVSGICILCVSLRNDNLQITLSLIFASTVVSTPLDAAQM